jgi:hypothetical protein
LPPSLSLLAASFLAFSSGPIIIIGLWKKNQEGKSIIIIIIIILNDNTCSSSSSSSSSNSSSLVLVNTPNHSTYDDYY